MRAHEQNVDRLARIVLNCHMQLDWTTRSQILASTYRGVVADANEVHCIEQLCHHGLVVLGGALSGGAHVVVALELVEVHTDAN